MNLVDNTNGFTNALQHLRYNKHEVILFHVCDKDKEIELNFDNSPRRFIDMETGEQIKATPQRTLLPKDARVGNTNKNSMQQSANRLRSSRYKQRI